MSSHFTSPSLHRLTWLPRGQFIAARDMSDSLRLRRAVSLAVSGAVGARAKLVASTRWRTHDDGGYK